MTGAQCLSSSNGRCPLGGPSWLAQYNNVYQVSSNNYLAVMYKNVYQVAKCIKYFEVMFITNVYLVVMADVPWVPLWPAQHNRLSLLKVVSA